MPHSSGGGSSNGGGHGGSSSGSNSSSSGVSFGFNGSSRSRISNTYFPNSRRFVTYRDNRPNYIYSDIDLSKRKKSKLIILYLCFAPFFILAFWIISLAFIRAQEPLKNSLGYQSTIVDNIDIISESEEISLQKTLDEFTETTGVPVMIYTNYNSVWMDEYESLSVYSYHCYLEQFHDEIHWLIVYTCDLDEENNISDWYWEGMQGDYTDKVLDVFLESFNDNLQLRLLENRSNTIANELIVTFSEASSTFRSQEEGINYSTLKLGFKFLAIVALIFGVVYFIIKKIQNFIYMPCTELSCSENEPETEICSCCGKEYVAHIHQRCPYCNAKITSTDNTKDSLFQ